MVLALLLESIKVWTLVWSFLNLIKYWIHERRLSYRFSTFILALGIYKKVVKTKTCFLTWVIENTHWNSGFFDCTSSTLFSLRLFKFCFVHYKNCCYWGWCPSNLYSWPEYWLLHDLSLSHNNCLGFFKSFEQKTGCLFLTKLVDFWLTLPYIFLKAYRLFFLVKLPVFLIPSFYFPNASQ